MTMLSLTLRHMRKVTSFCANCAEFYCETCASYHRKFGFSRDHKLRPAAEVDEKALKAALNQTKIPYCGQHPEAKLHLYCDTCQVPVCATCCMLTHKQHEHRELAAMGQECQDKLTRHSKTATGHIITLDKCRKELEACQTNIQRDATKACQEVQQAADELRSLVTKREQHLIQANTRRREDSTAGSEGCLQGNRAEQGQHAEPAVIHTGFASVREHHRPGGSYTWCTGAATPTTGSTTQGSQLDEPASRRRPTVWLSWMPCWGLLAQRALW